MLQVIKVADGKQALVDLLGNLAAAAGADLQLAKIRMTQGQVAAQGTQPMAEWAIWGGSQAG